MLRMLHDTILVKPELTPLSETLDVITGAIEQGDSCRGEVIAVGPGKEVKGRRLPVDVRVGDIIHFKRHETYPVYAVDDERYWIIREADIEFRVERA